ALILDGAAPTYNVASASTALGMVPAHGAIDVDFAAPSQAYRYGLYATGGTIALRRDVTNLEQGSLGDARSLRFTAGSSVAGVALGIDADDTMQRARALADGTVALGGGTLQGAVALARADLAV